MKTVVIKSKLSENELADALVTAQSELVDAGFVKLKDEPVKNVSGEEGDYTVTISVDHTSPELVKILDKFGSPATGTKYFDSEDDNEEKGTGDDPAPAEPTPDPTPSDPQNPDDKEVPHATSDKERALNETKMPGVEHSDRTQVKEFSEDENLVGIKFVCNEGKDHSELVKAKELVGKLAEITSTGGTIALVTTDLDSFNKESINNKEMEKEVKTFSTLLFSDDELGDPKEPKQAEEPKNPEASEPAASDPAPENPEPKPEDAPAEEPKNEPTPENPTPEPEKEPEVKTFSQLLFSDEEIGKKPEEENPAEPTPDPTPEVPAEEPKADPTPENPVPENPESGNPQPAAEPAPENPEPENPENPTPEPTGDDWKSPVEIAREANAGSEAESLIDLARKENEKTRKI